MNKSEDYLDSLLNNVAPERKSDAKRRKKRKSTDFVREFENELDNSDMDFSQDFEDEVGDTEGLEEAGDSFFDNLEGIVNNAQTSQKPDKDKDSAAGTYEVNTLEDDAWTQRPQTPAQDTPARSSEEQELLDMLSELPLNEAPSIPQDIMQDGPDSFPQEDLDDIPEKESLDEQESAKDKKGGKKKKSKKDKKDKSDKPGVFQKLSRIVFGEDDEEEEKETAPQKEKKKKEKKPKEKKPKQPKPPKEKKPKQPKEKKPKKPKEIDLSPPLPKGPVVLIFLMAASAIVFVVLTVHLLGYSTTIRNAKKAYAAQDYIEGYQQMAGIVPKEEDMELNEQLLLLARLQNGMMSGEALYGQGQYTMALNAYVCAIGRYDLNYAQAETYGIQAEYDTLAQQIAAQLQEKFGVDEATAREIYSLADREEYTRRLYQIITALGLPK